MNQFGYQETMPHPVPASQPAQQPQNRSTCGGCADEAPFGCDVCRRAVRKIIDTTQRIYIGGGEVMPQWI